MACGVSTAKMSTAIKSKIPGLYVGTDKHQWWKEAVVYQVGWVHEKQLQLISMIDLSCIIPRFEW